MKCKLRSKLVQLLKDFIRLFANTPKAFSVSQLKQTFKRLRIRISKSKAPTARKAMQTTMANLLNTNGQLATSCSSPPCTPSPCHSPINVTNLSDHSNHSLRSSPHQTSKIGGGLASTPAINCPTTLHSTTAAANLLLNQVVALSSPLSTSPTASSPSSSPSSSLASPIALDHGSMTADQKFSTADLLLQQQAQQLNASIKTQLLTQAKARTNGSTIKEEKNGKVSNFSIEAIMARDVENQNIKSGI